MKSLSWKILLFGFMCFLSLCFVVFLIISILSVTSDDTIEEEKVYEYQYLRRDYENDLTSVGYVSLQEYLDKDKFLSYGDEDGLALISNFGETEYECLGSCTCKGNRRTAGSHAIFSGLRYLLVGATSVVAINLAQKHFNEKCLTEMDGKCESSLVEANVDDCYTLMGEGEDEEDKVVFIKGKMEDDGHPNEIRRFLCIGHCIRTMSNEVKNAGKDAQKFRCEQLKKEGDVILTTSSLPLYARSFMGGVGADRFGFVATMEFRNRYLTNFCLEESKIEYEYEYKDSKTNEMKKLKKKIAACQGTAWDKRGGLLQNVVCRQITPGKEEIQEEQFRDEMIGFEDKNNPDLELIT